MPLLLQDGLDTLIYNTFRDKIGSYTLRNDISRENVTLMFAEIFRYLGHADLKINGDTLVYTSSKEHPPLVVDDSGYKAGKQLIESFLIKIERVVSGEISIIEYESFIGNNMVEEDRLEDLNITLQLIKRLKKGLGPDRKAEGKVEWLNGTYLFFEGKISEARRHFLYSLRAYLRDDNMEGVGDAYLALANVEGNSNNVEKALAFYDKAYSAYREINSEKGMAKVNANVSQLYARNGMLWKANWYLRLASRTFELMHDKNYLRKIFINKAALMISHGKYKDAFEHADYASYASLEVGSDRLYYLSNLSMVEIEIARRRYKSNRSRVEEAINYFKKNHLIDDLAFSYGVLAMYHLSKREEPMAFNIIKKMIDTYIAAADIASLVAMAIRLMRMMVIYKNDDKFMKKCHDLFVSTLSKYNQDENYISSVLVFYIPQKF